MSTNEFNIKIYASSDLSESLELLKGNIRSLSIVVEKLNEETIYPAYNSVELNYDERKVRSILLKKKGVDDETIVFISDYETKETSLVSSEEKYCFIDSAVKNHIDIATLIALSYFEIKNPNRYGGIFRKKIEGNISLVDYDEDEQKIIKAIESGFRNNAHVFITHGIRTHCYWADEVREIFRKKYKYDVTVLRYGLISTLTFLFSETIRDKLAVDLLVQVRNITKDNPNSHVSIVVHSYSSILLFKALEIAEKLSIEIRIDAVILNASILKFNIDWSKFMRFDVNNVPVSIRRVLNICGDNDVWPIIASHLVPNAGSSGVFFFSVDSKNFRNIRVKNCGHSDMLTKDHCENLWVPFINGDELQSDSEHVRPTKLIENFNSYFWAILALILLVIYLLYKTFIYISSSNVFSLITCMFNSIITWLKGFC